jgi:preprotein translocase subunit SecD
VRHISYKTLLLVAIVVGIAVASLVVQQFRFSALGFTMDRGGDTLLGLQMGLDLRGGVHLVYQAQPDPDDSTPLEDQMSGVVDTIKRRVDAFGVTEPVIQRMGDDRLLVQLPGVGNIAEAKRLIGQTATMDFRERICNAAPCNVENPSNWEEKETGLSGSNLSRAYVGTQPTTGVPIVNFEFNSDATRVFADLTTRLARDCTSQALVQGTCDQIAIYLDGQELISPIAQTPILSGSGFIEGPDFTFQRAQTLTIQLNSGRLPVPIEVIQERDVDATLGSEALRRSLVAGLVGAALLLFFLIAYYRMAGVVAALSLVLYIIIVLGVFKLVPVTITLAGVGAFVISLGMAVDANVLIFERMKEELRMGRSLQAALQIGFSRAWPSIRDSNITTFITSAVLLWFGHQFGETQIIGFALTLFIGVSTSMFSAVTISRVLMSTMIFTPLKPYRGLFSPEGFPFRKTETAPVVPGNGRERG